MYVKIPLVCSSTKQTSNNLLWECFGTHCSSNFCQQMGSTHRLHLIVSLVLQLSSSMSKQIWLPLICVWKCSITVTWTCFTDVPRRGELWGFKSGSCAHWILNFLQENVKNCTLISRFASASGGQRSSDSLPELCPWSSLGTSLPHHVNPLPCRILGTLMTCFNQLQLYYVVVVYFFVLELIVMTW